MNEQEIKTKIEQNQIDSQKLIDEGKKLAGASAKIQKPPLRHGDLRLWPGCLGIVDKSEPAMHMLWIDGEKRSNCISEENVLNDSKPVGTLKDIFDDLERNSKDLTKFQEGNITVDIDSYNCLRIKQFKHKIRLSMCCARSFIIKLRRMVATAEGKNK